MKFLLNVLLLIPITCWFSFYGFAFEKLPLQLRSPDKKIQYEFDIKNGKPGYSILYQGKKLVNFSILNLVFKGDALVQGVRLVKASRLDSVEQYTLITGRSGLVNDSFRQLSLFLEETNSPGRLLTLQVRIFNDGIAFRYLFPKVNDDSLFLQRELTHIEIAGNPGIHALVLPDYHSSHEGFYLHRTFYDLPEDSLLDMPLLLAFPDSIYMAITEAALLDYAGMYLVKNKSGFVSNLSR